MKETIRLLNEEDYPLLEAMDTGKSEDYVKRIFDRLITGPNRLYGLFSDGKLASVGGYSIYAKRYAMLGRLRSDMRFRGKNFATKLMEFVKDEAFKVDEIHWVGANTQEENFPARRVLEKMGFQSYTMLHGAITKDTSALESGGQTWNKIHDMQQKIVWLDEMYLKTKAIFPYECYYPFPASTDLFQKKDLDTWTFYENMDQTRILITKVDQKKHKYLHAIYPWNDINNQKGLWETISKEYQELLKQTEEETYIWMDLTKEEANQLPENHSFELPSPWILFGIEKTQWKKSKNPTNNMISL
ncbi:GNAT family N-acetyltransferase [Ornithinibacillus halophilus]|uniref:Acetyltransferase (GNAT) family protein n=1 Tax=Ornithinibacillus halophilus TaxID=930117 RepID=A0A1M5IH68_9BACI|nr:GNAT family N-acetyltransferase [Ornithinibacillus halophilus]SHG27419.1 Acetyltransferase (GNAT) family protein [Ornithinibacillus halophilus]